VLLTGLYAYKIKKPVALGFVDFSTLDKRKYYCEEELRLNKRFAADLYLEVIGIRGSFQSPKLSGDHAVIEYALKMKQFPQSALLSTMASENRLESWHIDSFAKIVSSFHERAPGMPARTRATAVDIILKWSRENFDQLEINLPHSKRPEYFNRLKKWCLRTDTNILRILHDRIDDGYIRECHGDLHLGNIALIDHQITLFDCIEFNLELRYIDTASEIAFVAMDLQARGFTSYAWRFINRYLSASGDYKSLEILRYYVAYRALVRAKIALIQAGPNQIIHKQNRHVPRECLNYFELAQNWTNNYRPAIIIMHGLSGSGKSTVASQLSECLGAIQIRSDIERKRLHHLKPRDNSGSNLNQGIYTQTAGRQTYERLAGLAESIVDSGFTVIVDASFLDLEFRNQFKALALRQQVPYIVVSCEAPVNTLRERIKSRSTTKLDASEANLDVLRQQLKSQDIVGTAEMIDTHFVICTEQGLDAAQLNGIKQQIKPSDSLQIEDDLAGLN
jgi:aminoglycoside phosphotransferase family enzyme/predicted kinase